MDVKIGVDMGGTRIKVGYLNNDGQLVYGQIIDASSHLDMQTSLDYMASEINLTLGNKDLTPTGIGIAFPGIIDSDKNRILSKYVKYADAQRFDLSSWALEKWNIPLVLENDARAALVGEWQYGAGRGYEDLVMVTLGTGVGSAVLLNGHVIRGANFMAGNLGGHMTLDYHGSRCNCGHIGCVELEASTWSLKEMITSSERFPVSSLANENVLDFKSVFEHAEQGDTLATEIKAHCINIWALGILNMVLAYDPEAVVIGGGIMNGANDLIEKIQEYASHNIWLKDKPLKIKVAEELEYAGILGLNYLLK